MFCVGWDSCTTLSFRSGLSFMCVAVSIPPHYILYGTYGMTDSGLMRIQENVEITATTAASSWCGSTGELGSYVRLYFFISSFLVVLSFGFRPNPPCVPFLPFLLAFTHWPLPLLSVLWRSSSLFEHLPPESCPGSYLAEQTYTVTGVSTSGNTCSIAKIQQNSAV